MTIYKLSDGTEHHFSGKIQKEERIDGWYVIANNQAVKVKDEASADQYIRIYNRDKYKIISFRED